MKVPLTLLFSRYDRELDKENWVHNRRKKLLLKYHRVGSIFVFHACTTLKLFLMRFDCIGGVVKEHLFLFFLLFYVSLKTNILLKLIGHE